MPTTGGPAQQLTSGGAQLALESADGQLLFLLRNEKESDWLYTMPAKGGAWRRIARVPMRPTLWVVPRGVYFVAAESLDTFPMLSFFDTRSLRVHAIARIPKRLRGLATGLTGPPDEKHLLLSTYELESDLMLVENFR